MSCGSYVGVYGSETRVDLLSRVTDSRFAALRTVLIAYAENWTLAFPVIDVAALRQVGIDLRFTKAGRFRSLNVREGVVVDFEHDALVKDWEHASAIITLDQILVGDDLTATAKRYLQRPGFPMHVKREIWLIFMSYHKPNRAPGPSITTSSGVSLGWM